MNCCSGRRATSSRDAARDTTPAGLIFILRPSHSSPLAGCAVIACGAARPDDELVGSDGPRASVPERDVARDDVPDVAGPNVIAHAITSADVLAEELDRALARELGRLRLIRAALVAHEAVPRAGV